MAVRVVSDQPLAISQHDRFLNPPEQRKDRSLPSRPNHWHLTAEAGTPAQAGFFLAVLVPHKADAAAPAIEPFEVESGRAFRVGNLIVAAPVPANAQSRLEIAGRPVVANLAILEPDGNVLVATT